MKKNECRADYSPNGNNGSSGSEPQGSQSNPFTLYQFLNWQGVWRGGWVEGLGFIETINISSNGSSGSGSSSNSSLLEYLNSHGNLWIDGSGNIHWTRTS